MNNKFTTKIKKLNT